jgi:hypothetical protein
MRASCHRVVSHRSTKPLAISLGVVTAALVLAARLASAAPPQELAFHGPDALARLAEVVVGQGINGVETSAVHTPDGSTVEWRVVEDRTDNAGERHLVYQQVLVPGRELAEQLPSSYATSGLRMLGGVAGLHFEGNVLTSVFLSQHREPRLEAVPSVLRPETAFMIVQDAQNAEQSGDRSTWLERGPAELRNELDRTEALVMPDPEGRLRVVWQVPSFDGEGVGQTVLLDAASLTRTAGERSQHFSTCTPGTTARWATGIPQNPVIASRALMGGSVDAVGRTDGWAYEASWPGNGTSVPTVNVWMAWDTATSGFRCTQGGKPASGIFPLGLVGTMPTYGPSSTPALTGGKNIGSSSGDAIWAGYVIGSYLHSLFGIRSYDNAGSPINFYMLWTYPANGGFIGYANWETRGMESPEGVVIYPAGLNSLTGISYPREASASLDVIGHEVGHGVINHSAGRFMNVPTLFVYNQLQEAFADVFGYSIEQKYHPTGTGFEKRDWMFGEDHMSPTATGMRYWRRVDANDGHSSYHKDHHPAKWDTDFYVQANILPVALRLLAVGGTNPICPGYSGCTTTVAAQGIDKAAKILGGVVTQHSLEVTGWESVVQLAKFEAYRQYKRCTLSPPYNASTEQQAVRDAFTAIGYPDPNPILQCP